MNRTLQQSYHVAGTLAADLSIVFAAHADLTLLYVSAVASNDSDATLKIGSAADDDKFLEAAAIGDSSTPVEFGRSDFVGAQYPRIARGEVIVLALDFDGNEGTAAHDVTLVLTLAEG